MTNCHRWIEVVERPPEVDPEAEAAAELPLLGTAPPAEAEEEEGMGEEAEPMVAGLESVSSSESEGET